MITKPLPQHPPPPTMPQSLTPDWLICATKSCMFHKLIVSSILHDSNLKIPAKFVKSYGEELSSLATVSVPNGRFWVVELKRIDDEIWFENGWHEFVEFYSIRAGHFLLFRYEGKSHFTINIFDLTVSELKYPFSGSENLQESRNECPATIKEEVQDDEIKEMACSASPCLSFESSRCKKLADGGSCNNIGAAASLQRSKTASGKKWSPEHEVILMRSWLDVSKNPLVGTDQQSGPIWARVATKLNEVLPHEEQRSAKACKNHFHHLSKLVKKFSVHYNCSKTVYQSELSEEVHIQKAQEAYYEQEHVSFRHDHVWKIIRDHPTWNGTIDAPIAFDDGSYKRTKNTESGSYTSSVSGSFELNVDEGLPSVNEENLEEVEPPQMGINAINAQARKKENTKRKQHAEQQSDAANLDDLIKRKANQFQKVFEQQQMEQLEQNRIQNEQNQQMKDFEFYSRDRSTMDRSTKQFHTIICRDIERKYSLEPKNFDD